MDSNLKKFGQLQDQILLNPRLPHEERDSLQKIIQRYFLNEHFWLLSSGTESQREGRVKAVALSQTTVLSAARGVCQAFHIGREDVILNTLPLFHVSGLLQTARAEVSGARLVEASETPWEAAVFSQLVQKEEVTVTSLVPTQIFDLVQKQIAAPKSLKTVFVGGGAIEPTLYQKGRSLGWPLIRTYGMTETSAMIAYIPEDEEQWCRLPHLIKWETSDEQKLKFSATSLLTGFLLMDDLIVQWVDPKQEGWFVSDDRGAIANDRMTLLGRDSELVKIKGESVSLVEINQRWKQFSQEQQWGSLSVVIARPSPRDGHDLALVTEGALDFSQIEEFQKTLLPFQRIQHIYSNVQIPMSELGKIKMSLLLSELAAARD